MHSANASWRAADAVAAEEEIALTDVTDIDASRADGDPLAASTAAATEEGGDVRDIGTSTRRTGGRRSAEQIFGELIDLEIEHAETGIDSDALRKHCAGEVLRYHLARRRAAGMGRCADGSWPGQIRQHARELLSDPDDIWAPTDVCDILDRWHAQNLKRALEGKDALPPGAIKTIAQGILDASNGAATHGVDGLGTTAREKRASDAHDALLTAIAGLAS